MVPQTARKPRTRKAAQPTIVQVQPADITLGLYGALSSDGSQWYSVNVATRSCTCPSGAHGFVGVTANGGTCKHVVAARTIARALASMSPAARATALRMTNIRVRVEAVDVAALDAPLARPSLTPAPVPAPAYVGAAGLLEAYGVAA